MSNVTMKAKDTLSAKLAECFMTIEGRRYNIMQAIDAELKFTKKKTKVPILGKTGEGNKASGWSGTGKTTLHYNTSILRELALRYKDTGEDIYFDMQITNEDPSSAAGKQTLIAYDCNVDDLILAKFDANAEYLDEDVNFTFDDFAMPDTFNLLDGM